MHIYAFGSICRGDISIDSDIDLLALVDGIDPRFNPDVFSIYTYKRITDLWESGNAFAWHLALESKMIFSEDGSDFIRRLGTPREYVGVAEDCRKFIEIFESALSAIREGTPSLVFELSTIFLSIRNVATCFSLAKRSQPIFGRDSARSIGTDSISISDDLYSILVRSRLLSVRGIGDDIAGIDRSSLIDELAICSQWMNDLYEEIINEG